MPEGDPGWRRWAVFERGNQVATVHGATSVKHLRPLVDDLLVAAYQLAPWCSAPVFAPTVEAWAWAEATVILYRRHFDAEGLALDEDEPTKGVDRWHRAERHAIGLREQLGLSPVALTKLLSNLSTLTPAAATEGLSELQKVGAGIRAAIEAAPTSDPPGDPAELEEGVGDEAGDDVGGDGVHTPSGRPSRDHGAGGQG